jgi:hypothetical protein
VNPSAATWRAVHTAISAARSSLTASAAGATQATARLSGSGSRPRSTKMTMANRCRTSSLPVIQAEVGIWHTPTWEAFMK